MVKTKHVSALLQATIQLVSDAYVQSKNILMAIGTSLCLSCANLQQPFRSSINPFAKDYDRPPTSMITPLFAYSRLRLMS